MSDAPPILVRFTGVGFEPANSPMMRRCEQFFVVNEIYRIEFRDERSGVSHRHFFASINEAWKNLPDDLSDRFPTAEHLRKWALCKAGFADERTVVCDTQDDADRVTALSRALDSYAVIVPRGLVIKIYTARSMSVRAMDRKTFQAAKQATLNIVADLIGVDPATLASNAQHDDQDQPNEIPASDRTVDRADNESPPAAPRTETVGEAPPPASPGASTLESSQPRSDTDDATQPEGTENAGGGDHLPKPKTYNEYLVYLTAWLSYVKSAERIYARIEKEKAEMWPKLDPALTLGQRNYFMKLAADAANKL